MLWDADRAAMPGNTKSNLFKSRPFFLIFLLLLLQACVKIPKATHSPAVQQPLAPIEYHSAFGEKPHLPSADRLFELTAEQQDSFTQYLTLQQSYGTPAHEIVTDYLTQFNQDFNYYSATLTARDAFEKRQGNCLSLAILTTAIARLAAVEVGYQLMDMRPVYSKQGQVVFTAQHVRSILYDPDYVSKTDTIVFMRPLIIIDYFPTNRSSIKEMVSENDFVSMYFRNIAADAIAERDYKKAFWLADESLKYSPNNSHALNMLAVIYENMGYQQNAEQLYQYGLKYSQEELELLSNYKSFLARHKRYQEAELIKQRIEQINEPNPFDWLKQADEELAMNNLDEALRYYNKVIQLAPYLHHGYAGKAKIEFLRGNTSRAKIAFKKAKEMTVDEETSLLMRAKLSALNDYESQN